MLKWSRNKVESTLLSQALDLSQGSERVSAGEPLRYFLPPSLVRP
jgi:hypothetical protein